MTLKNGLDYAASIAMILAALAILYVNVGRPTAKTSTFRIPEKPISISESAILGSQTAPVVAIIYSDFHCPFCKRLAVEILPKIRAAYVDDGRMALVFKHLPIESLHPSAFRAAEIASCGLKLGRFWEMHDALFIGPKSYPKDTLVDLANQAKVESLAFLKCLEAPPTEEIRRDMAEAEAMGLASTPFTLIGRREPNGAIAIKKFIAGAKPLADFEKEIGAVLASRF